MCSFHTFWRVGSVSTLSNIIAISSWLCTSGLARGMKCCLMCVSPTTKASFSSTVIKFMSRMQLLVHLLPRINHFFDLRTMWCCVFWRRLDNNKKFELFDGIILASLLCYWMYKHSLTHPPFLYLTKNLVTPFGVASLFLHTTFKLKY